MAQVTENLRGIDPTEGCETATKHERGMIFLNFWMLRTAAGCQIEFLSLAYTNLANRHALHRKLKFKRKHKEAKQHHHNTVDVFSSFKLILSQWNVGAEVWCFTQDIPEVVA